MYVVIFFENCMKIKQKSLHKISIINFINKKFRIRIKQPALVDTFKSFYNKSGLRKLFRGHITE